MNNNSIQRGKIDRIYSTYIPLINIIYILSNVMWMKSIDATLAIWFGFEQLSI